MPKSRREFLGFLGGAAVGGRQAIEHVAKLAGVETSGLSAGTGMGVPIAGGDGGWMQQERWMLSRRLGYVLRHGIPERDLRIIERDAKRVAALDPDLAAMHSVSMAAKVNRQQHRNFARAKEEYIENMRIGSLPWLNELVE